MWLNRALFFLKKQTNQSSLKEVSQILGYKDKKELLSDIEKRSHTLKKKMEHLSSAQKADIFGTERNSSYQYIEVSPLTSSWQSQGRYYRNHFKKNGRLDLTLLSGKTYSYYGVPKHVWEKMKDANGSGTVFWKYYLHKYKTNTGHRRIGVLIEMAGI